MSYWKSKNIISKQRAHDQASEVYFHVGLTFQHLIRKELLVDPEQVAGTGEVAEKVFVVVRQEWEVLCHGGDGDQPLRSISVALLALRALRVFLGGWHQPASVWFGRSSLEPWRRVLDRHCLCVTLLWVTLLISCSPKPGRCVFVSLGESWEGLVNWVF